jgi:hypothetical protein
MPQGGGPRSDRFWQGSGIVLLERLGASRLQPIATLAAVATAAAIAAPVALPATGHAFNASYRGHGSGDVSGTRASGSATASGRGRLIGPGTLTGSASGVFVSQTCVVFSGTATLEGTAGSIRLGAHGAQACADGTDAASVTFSGRAQVTGGTSTFAGAHGTLSFTGTYVRASGAVTISFSGRIRY